MKEDSIVRQNMMDDKNYTPYCGGSVQCIWPRTVWVDGELICPACKSKLKFDPEFFARYKKKWNL